MPGDKRRSGWRIANDFQPVFWIETRDAEHCVTRLFDAREIGNGEVEVSLEIRPDSRRGGRKITLRLTPAEVDSVVALATGKVSRP
jgi:hypothetical protein